MSSQRKQRVKPHRSVMVAACNVHGCSKNVKKCEISKMFLRWKSEVCALSVSKLNGEVVGRVSAVGGMRAREVHAHLLSRWLLRCVVE